MVKPDCPFLPQGRFFPLYAILLSLFLLGITVQSALAGGKIKANSTSPSISTVFFAWLERYYADDNVLMYTTKVPDERVSTAKLINILQKERKPYGKQQFIVDRKTRVDHVYLPYFYYDDAMQFMRYCPTYSWPEGQKISDTFYAGMLLPLTQDKFLFVLTVEGTETITHGEILFFIVSPVQRDGKPSFAFAMADPRLYMDSFQLSDFFPKGHTPIMDNGPPSYYYLLYPTTRSVFVASDDAVIDDQGVYLPFDWHKNKFVKRTAVTSDNLPKAIFKADPRYQDSDESNKP